MDAFEIADLLRERRAQESPYLEFLRHPALSCGIYELSAGANDRQRPHAEDEVYYVLSGRAVIEVGEEERPVQMGTVVYVAAGVPHRFRDITEDLSLLVLFAPAEG